MRSSVLGLFGGTRLLILGDDLAHPGVGPVVRVSPLDGVPHAGQALDGVVQCGDDGLDFAGVGGGVPVRVDAFEAVCHVVQVGQLAGDVGGVRVAQVVVAAAAHAAALFLAMTSRLICLHCAASASSARSNP